MGPGFDLADASQFGHAVGLIGGSRIDRDGTLEAQADQFQGPSGDPIVDFIPHRFHPAGFQVAVEKHLGRGQPQPLLTPADSAGQKGLSPAAGSLARKTFSSPVPLSSHLLLPFQLPLSSAQYLSNKPPEERLYLESRL
jgi:hypothetical protein